jgi:hypothetical protein
MCPFTNNESSSHKKKNWDDSPKKIFCEKKDHKVNIINLHVLEMGQTYWSEEQQKKNLTASFHGSTPSPIFILNILQKKIVKRIQSVSLYFTWDNRNGTTMCGDNQNTHCAGHAIHARGHAILRPRLAPRWIHGNMWRSIRLQ